MLMTGKYGSTSTPKPQRLLEQGSLQLLWIHSRGHPHLHLKEYASLDRDPADNAHGCHPTGECVQSVSAFSITAGPLALLLSILFCKDCLDSILVTINGVLQRANASDDKTTCPILV